MSASNGKVVIVTGASSGIGEATARRLAAGGARVTAVARRADRLASLVAAIRQDGGEAMAVATDVTDRSAVDDAVRQTLDAWGTVDVLINNAGIMPLSPIRECRVEEWERMFDVNVKGLLYGVAAVLPIMLDRGRGHIVNVGSVAGRRPFPTGSIYAASKFAVRAISAGLRLELSPNDNIRVTDIEPGVVDTELTNTISDRQAAEAFRNQWVKKTPLASDDVAVAIEYVLAQPNHVNVNELLVRPTEQEG